MQLRPFRSPAGPPCRVNHSPDIETGALSSHPHRNPPAAALLRAGLIGLALLALALPGIARAAYMIPGGNIRPKDFTLVKKDGVYHLFYTLNDVSLPAALTQNKLGHAISMDLYHWSQLPTVLPADPGGWDNLHVWAPSIVARDSVWWMFYTGVSSVPGQYNGTQRVGLAVSSDLNVWTRVGAGPVYAATQVPWAWSQPLSGAPAFRDPFVMPDPAHPGSWLLYLTVSYGPDTASTVVGVARSSGDFTQWSDVKPLTETWAVYSYNPLTESPHLFQHNGLWYLFITTSAGQPLTFYTAADPIAAQPLWTYRGRLRNMLGYDTSAWFASEYFRDGTHDLFLFDAGDRIEVREIQWGAGWQFSLLQPALFHVVNMNWVGSTVASGQMATLRVQSANPLAGTPHFQVLKVDSLGAETPVPSDSVGFFPSPTFYTDTTFMGWVTRRYPSVPDSDTVTVSRYRVRTTDLTVASGVLTVTAPRAAQPPQPPDPSPLGDPGNPGEPTDIVPHSPFGVRPVALAFAGAAVAVRLADPAAARMDVFDLAGRRVRSLAERRLAAGVTVIAWDGRDDDGVAQPHGLYFARVTSGAFVGTARIVLAPR